MAVVLSGIAVSSFIGDIRYYSNDLADTAINHVILL